MLGRNFWNCIFTLLLEISFEVQLPDILWDPDDPIYNKEKCGSESTVLKVKQGDMINIICSNRDLNNAILTADRNRRRFHYNIHVTDDINLYQERQISNENGSVANTVHECRENLHTEKIIKTVVEKYKVIFSRWGSTKGRIFEVGKTYYFFTTSNGTEASLQNTFAPNATKHMGFQVYVCRSNETCDGREKLHRCIERTNTRNKLPLVKNEEKVSGPEMKETEAPPESDSGLKESEFLYIIIAIVFVVGLVFGFLFDRFCLMRRRNGSGQEKQNTFLRVHSCTGTEKTNVSDGSLNEEGQFEQQHMVHV